MIFEQKSLVRNLGQDYESNDAGGDVGVYIVYFVGFLEFVDVLIINLSTTMSIVLGSAS